jgi:hypothetical protein
VSYDFDSILASLQHILPDPGPPQGLPMPKPPPVLNRYEGGGLCFQQPKPEPEPEPEPEPVGVERRGGRRPGAGRPRGSVNKGKSKGYHPRKSPKEPLLTELERAELAKEVPWWAKGKWFKAARRVY